MCGFLVTTDITIEKPSINNSFKTITHRGPDSSKILDLPKSAGVMAFHRLAIMGPGQSGDQPFSVEDKLYIVCNGEIYNHRTIKTDYIDTFKFKSTSDCEVLLPLYLDLGIKKLCQVIDAEFALVIYDQEKDLFFAARDPMGIRPLFYGYTKKQKKITFASEAKALVELCEDIKPFPPGHYYDGKEIKPFHDHTKVESYIDTDLDNITEGIKYRLIDAVKKRLDSDVPVGFLLSGGLDSSLVCAIAAKYTNKPITTFSVGITDNPIDTKYAKVVADYIGSDHHEYLFTKEQMIQTLPELVYQLETWDITTIRAAMGMYLICKYVKEETDIKVILTGEVSDEIFGYKYTDYAPSELAFQKEAEKRVKELFLYDVLRADRSISSHSLEARVPFSDKEFVDYVMSIHPKFKMNTTGVGKYLLRKAFEGDNFLPKDILYREKAAFSDAVGHSMVDWLKEYAEVQYTDEEFKIKCSKYKHATPFTKESLLYREIFEKSFEGLGELIPDYWMPNKEWKNCDVKDPSARVLPNYGKSGS